MFTIMKQSPRESLDPLSLVSSIKKLMSFKNLKEEAEIIWKEANI